MRLARYVAELYGSLWKFTINSEFLGGLSVSFLCSHPPPPVSLLPPPHPERRIMAHLWGFT